MEVWLIGVYLLVSGLAALQALLVVIQTWEHHRFARSRLSLLSRYPRKGMAMVIAPCRGVDVGLEGNLRSLFRQDYGEFRIRFVVESPDDPACAVIRRVMASHPEVACELLFAGRAEGEGQKVHNLRIATGSLPAHVEYLAFVDSDARVRRQWLRALLARLDRPEVGAASGYRWFVPCRDSVANHLLGSVNSRVAVFFGSRSPTVVWGGSWAIRRDRFDALGLHKAWCGTLSDDLVASRLLRQSGLRVIFEPACMATSPADVTLAHLVAFVRRQYLMGRFYTVGGWILALLLTSFVNAVAAGSVALLAVALATGLVSPWLPGAVCAALYGLSALGGLLRQDLALSYFPHLHTRLRRARRFEIWSGPLVGMVNWVAVLGSVVGRTVRWRGITYVVRPGGRVAAIRREDRAGFEAREQAGETPSFDDSAGPAVIPLPSPRPEASREDATDLSQRRCA